MSLNVYIKLIDKVTRTYIATGDFERMEAKLHVFAEILQVIDVPQAQAYDLFSTFVVLYAEDGSTPNKQVEEIFADVLDRISGRCGLEERRLYPRSVKGDCPLVYDPEAIRAVTDTGKALSKETQQFVSTFMDKAMPTCDQNPEVVDYQPPLKATQHTTSHFKTADGKPIMFGDKLELTEEMRFGDITYFEGAFFQLSEGDAEGPIVRYIEDVSKDDLNTDYRPYQFMGQERMLYFTIVDPKDSRVVGLGEEVPEVVQEECPIKIAGGQRC